MPFRPRRKQPEFADLKGILAQSKDTDNALYQVVQEIIERLTDAEFGTTTVIQSGDGGGGGGGGANPNATYLTKNDETAALPNALQFLARYGLRFDDSLANKRTIDLDLEYLGQFAAGPLYSDGDVVVGPDNIAYLCVRPTNNPPVTWPGVGMASAVGPPGPTGPAGTPGDFNATYWTVTASPNLTNERALDVLGTGYVRSTAGEPSVVATIPLTDTTGTLPDNRLTSNVALKNINNNFVAQTIGAYSTFTGANGLVMYQDTSSPVDKRIWRHLSYSNGEFYLESMNDAQNVVNVQFYFTQTGTIGAGNFSGGGSNLTNLHAPNIATGIVNPARLGSGTANSTTFLRGDSTWQTISGIPSGLIVISVSPCPVGWTRVNWDGYFIRSGPSPGASGGAGSHTHDSGTMKADSHTHGNVSISGNTNGSGTHRHGYSGGVSGTTGTENAGSMNVDAGGSGNMARAGHGHSFGASFSGETDSGGEHSHSFSGSGATASSGLLPVNGNTGAASNLPPFIDVFFCQKD